MKALKNKQGFSYILVCVFILAAVLLTFVALQYASIYHIAREQKQDTQLTLDSYVTTYAVNKYNALKQGTEYGKYIDRADLVDGAYSVLGSPRIITLEYRPQSNVDAKYSVSKLTVNALVGDSFGVYVTYDLNIPFEVFGMKIADVKVPVEIVSSYTEKY